MGKLDKAIEESEDASDKDKQSARDGRNMMSEASTTASVAVVDTADTGGRNGSNSNLDDDETENKNGTMNVQNELASIKKDANAAVMFVERGGVSGEKKDNYDISIKYNEWMSSRKFYNECKNTVMEKSIYYTTLVDGTVNDNQIINAYRNKENIKEQCDKAENDLLLKAIAYIEEDHRVKENKKARNVNIEGFQFHRNTDSVTDSAIGKEGFDWYRADAAPSGVKLNDMNPRLPLYTEKDKSNGSGTGVLAWGDFYTDCTKQSTNDVVLCKNAMNNKNTYVKSINNLFFEADTLINVLHQILYPPTGSVASTDSAGRNDILKKVVQQQSSDIDIFKQKAKYSYEEYNTLTYVEDAIIFIYYALVIIYVLLFCRDWIITRPPFNILQYIVILIMALYPKYILKIVLWILLALTNFVQLVGIKNVEFWS
jgi:hypothetical protein